MYYIIKGAQKATDHYAKNHNDGISQPAVVVLSKKGEVVYNWCTPASFKSGFGMFERINPKEVIEVVRFYFKENDLVDSIVSYVNGNLTMIFSSVMEDKEFRALFGKHLEDECNADSFNFMHDAERLKEVKKVKEAKNLESKILKNYIEEGSPNELNLPHKVRVETVELLREFIKKSDIKELEKHPLKKAYSHIRYLLKSDSFSRFIRKEIFVVNAAKLIPQLSSQISERKGSSGKRNRASSVG